MSATVTGDHGLARRLADAILPGGSLPNGVEAPAAGAVLDEKVLAGWHAAHGGVRAGLEAAAGGPAALEAAGPGALTGLLARLEAERPEAFAAWAGALLAAYYQEPAVLAAFGWRAAPPQPAGHALPPFDDSLLASQRRCPPLWRADRG